MMEAHGDCSRIDCCSPTRATEQLGAMQIPRWSSGRSERGGQTRRIVALVVAAAVSLQLSPASAACTRVGDALLILDASSSMLKVTSSGATRFNLARQAISATVDLFPNEALIACLIGFRFVERAARRTIHLVPKFRKTTQRSLAKCDAGVGRDFGNYPEMANSFHCLPSGNK